MLGHAPSARRHIYLEECHASAATPFACGAYPQVTNYHETGRACSMPRFRSNEVWAYSATEHRLREQCGRCRTPAYAWFPST